MKPVIRLLVLLLLPLLLLGENVQAEDHLAKEISGREILTHCEHFGAPERLFDGNPYRWQRAETDASLTLESEEGIGSFYVIFNDQVGGYRVKNEDDGREAVCGEKGYLHDYVDVKALFGGAPTSITLSFGDLRPQIGELRVFTEGQPPADVQQWKEAPEEGVDLLVLPTHGDDEQLFFAGLLPYYAGEKQYEVQVAYSTNHYNYGKDRPHEMLDGLWAVGVTNYPVFGPLPDYLTRNERDAVAMLKQAGIEREQVVGYVVELLRRFQPLVAVGHDLNGEYGHGSHRLYGHALQEAAEISMDPEQYPESAEQYGVWNVPKVYLHLYEEQPIHVNWDIPLEHFGGMTAYEVTKTYGFPAHESQYPDFAWYFAARDTAESIPEHGPCDYGLTHTTVGPDEGKDDMFEHLLSRAEQKKLEEEQKQKEEEQERKRQEEERKKKEAEKKAAALEAERLAAEQAEQAAEAARQKKQTCIYLGLGIAAMAGLLVLVIIKIRK